MILMKLLRRESAPGHQNGKTSSNHLEKKKRGENVHPAKRGGGSRLELVAKGPVNGGAEKGDSSNKPIGRKLVLL